MTEAAAVQVLVPSGCWDSGRQGEVLAVFAREGARVKRGDVLFWVSTERVDIKRVGVHAPAAGVVTKVHFEKGATISVGEALAEIQLGAVIEQQFRPSRSSETAPSAAHLPRTPSRMNGCSVCGRPTSWETVEVPTGYRIGLANVYRSETRRRDRCDACRAGVPVDGATRLRNATDLHEIARLLASGTYPRSHTSFLSPSELEWRAAVDATWRRLSEAGTFGPPSHDIVTAKAMWPLKGVLSFEELSRQHGWLVRDAMPFRVGNGPPREGKPDSGLMDVWIAADGQAFRRQELFLAWRAESLAAHDAQLTWYWRNDISHRGVIVAVPVGEPPRTEEEKRFLLPRETKALRDTILLMDKGARGNLDNHPDLGSALSALIRASASQ